MSLDEQFNQWSDADRRQFTADLFTYFNSAEQRHQAILDRLDTLIGALGVGLRAAGDALQQGNRRR